MLLRLLSDECGLRPGQGFPAFSSIRRLPGPRKGKASQRVFLSYEADITLKEADRALPPGLILW